MRKRKIYLRVILYVITGFILVQAVFILLAFSGAFGKIPDKETLKGIRNTVASEIYSADGVLMGNYYFQNRQNLDSGQITPTIRDALLATEDVRFYDHRGIDFRSLARVFF